MSDQEYKQTVEYKVFTSKEAKEFINDDNESYDIEIIIDIMAEDG